MSTTAGIVQQLKKEHERLTREIKGVGAALAAFGAAYGKRAGPRNLSAAATAKISKAQKGRWAKVRKNAGQKQNVVSMPRRRTMSAAGRKRIAAAQRARWAKIKGAQKKSA